MQVGVGHADVSHGLQNVLRWQELRYNHRKGT